MTRRMCAAFAVNALGAALCLSAAPAPLSAQEVRTQPELVATYSTLADGILALKRTEENLCRSVVAAAFGQARVDLAGAQKALAAGDAKSAQADIEALAAEVAEMATEGDNAVGAVRKRLIEGGQHHNAAGESQGIFDEGFVVVTKSAKASLLQSSRAIAQLAPAPKAEALEAEWKKVEAVAAEILKH